MTQRELDNLVRIGQLKSEPPAKAEFEGLLRSGNRRLSDAERIELSLESRFDLTYNAAHALALRQPADQGVGPNRPHSSNGIQRWTAPPDSKRLLTHR
jgi:hypothetical protein